MWNWLVDIYSNAAAELMIVTSETPWLHKGPVLTSLSPVWGLWRAGRNTYSWIIGVSQVHLHKHSSLIIGYLCFVQFETEYLENFFY